MKFEHHHCSRGQAPVAVPELSLDEFDAMNTGRSSFWLIAVMGVSFLCSCATQDPVGPPTEASFNEDAGSGGLWGQLLFVKLRSEDGEELLFNIDTGAPVTVLDKSLEPQLGRRLGKNPIHYAWEDKTAEKYRAPKLYLGDAPLQTGRVVWTDDLSRVHRPTPDCPVRGILGLDCLRHYVVQIDFVARKLRLIESDQLKTEDLGKAFPLTPDRSGHMTVVESFTGTKGLNLIVDTGCACDGVLEPEEFQRALQQQTVVWTNQFRYPGGMVRHTALLQKVVFGGETYTNLFIDKAPAMMANRRVYYLNAIGLPFLARHLVTFDFPNQTMYLKRRNSDGEQQSTSINSGPSNKITGANAGGPRPLPTRTRWAARVAQF